MRKQAKLRMLKTPDVLAQQAALNTVMTGRKGGAHQAQLSRREKLDAARVKEAHKDLHK